MVLAMRMLCSDARIDSSRVRSGMIDDDEWQVLTKSAGDLSEAPIYIDDTAQNQPSRHHRRKITDHELIDEIRDVHFEEVQQCRAPSAPPRRVLGVLRAP